MDYGSMGMGAGSMLGSAVGAYFLNKKHKSLGRKMDYMFMQYYLPALQYYQWLMDIAQNPSAYPEFMQGYLKNIMPQIGEWATAKGVYNPAAVSRKASENLFPYLMGLGIQGAQGMVGGYQPMPSWGLDYEKMSRQAGVLEGTFGAGMGQMMGGMGGGFGSQGTTGQGTSFAEFAKKYPSTYGGYWRGGGY